MGWFRRVCADGGCPGGVLDLVLIRRTEVVFLFFPFVISVLFPFPICHVGTRISLLRHIRDVAYMI